MNILITGSSGFIGFHMAKRLLEKNVKVVGIDNHNDYYDPKLKEARLMQLKQYSNFSFHKIDIVDKPRLNSLFKNENFDYVIHLAAQAGVRYSIDNPDAYTQSNLVGFMNILEACRRFPVKHLLYASSSSVYGGNTKVPFSVKDNVDHPVSLYAATKKANELLAHSYAHLYQIPMTGLRFFTVYGPYGRPDMAYYSFTQAIINQTPIQVFNHGNLERDFTYIDDIIESIERLIPLAPTDNLEAPHQVFNIGNNHPVSLMVFIETLEQCLGKKAIKNYVDMQQGDVLKTWADIEELYKKVNFKPNIELKEGLEKFVNWYKIYYKEEEGV